MEAASELVAASRALHERSGLYALALAHACALLPLAMDADDVDAVLDGHRAELTAALPELEAVRLLRSGRTTDTHQLLLRQRAAPSTRSYLWLATTVVHARLVVDLGIHELADALIADLAPYGARLADFGVVGCVGPVDLEVGRLHLLAGEADTAVQVLRSCLHRMEDQGIHLHAQRARVALAAALRARDETGDRGEATRLEQAPPGLGPQRPTIVSTDRVTVHHTHTS